MHDDLPTVPQYHFPKNMKRFCEAHTKPPMKTPKKAPKPLKADSPPRTRNYFTPPEPHKGLPVFLDPGEK